MADEGTAHSIPITLDYANADDSADRVAQDVLVRVLKWILIVSIAVQCLEILQILYYVLVRSGPSTGWNLIYVVVKCVVAYFNIRCLKALPTYGPAARKLFVTTFVLYVILNLISPVQSQLLFPRNWTFVAVGLVGTLLTCVVYGFHLLMLPIFHGRDTVSWFRSLYAASLSLLAALAVYSSFGAAAKLIVGSLQISLGDVTTFSIGSIIGIIVLLMLRKEFNKTVVLVVAGWTAFYLVGGMLEPMRGLVRGSLDYAVMSVTSLLSQLHVAFGLLPLWMLVWFAFRFEKSERIALASGE